jgi:hypothetical protein
MAFENSSPLTAAVPLPDDQTPDLYPATGTGPGGLQRLSGPQSPSWVDARLARVTTMAMCGSRAGYRVHLDNGEDPCGPCRAAARRSRGGSEPHPLKIQEPELLPLEVRIQEVRAKLARWQERIAEQCPGGPEHHYVQHRAWLPPWCDSCGWTDVGLHLSELGSGDLPADRWLRRTRLP